MNGQRPIEFVDIHCHLLPGLDDGPAGWEESLAMAEMAAGDGIRAVIATPHQLGNYAGNRGETIRARVAEFQRWLDQRQLPLAVLPGADVRIEPDLVARIRQGEVVTLADHRRHVLLELPHEVYLPLDRVLAELQSAGIAGILSHPERNLGILQRPEVLPPLVEAGCLLQVTAGSLTGAFGSRVQEFSEYLVKQGLVHFVATDAHSIRSRTPHLRAAYERIVKLAGRRTARRLCCQNPARVATGEPVPCESSPAEARKWSGWFRWKKAG